MEYKEGIVLEVSNEVMIKAEDEIRNNFLSGITSLRENRENVDILKVRVLDNILLEIYEFNIFYEGSIIIHENLNQCDDKKHFFHEVLIKLDELIKEKY